MDDTCKHTNTQTHTHTHNHMYTPYTQQAGKATHMKAFSIHTIVHMHMYIYTKTNTSRDKACQDRYI